MNQKSVEVDQHLYEVLCANGLDAAREFSRLRLKAELEAKGQVLNQQLEEYVIRTAQHELHKLTRSLRNLSLPSNLVKLFEIKSKKEAKKFAERELTLTHKEFANFILGAETFGFHHFRKHIEFVPEHLSDFSPKDLVPIPGTNKISAEGVKALRKISAIFKQRRQLSAHLFKDGFEWHCFFFDGADLMQNHWEGGDHIHYVSHLWGLSSGEVWNGFDRRDYSPAKAHIRYVHDFRSRG